MKQDTTHAYSAFVYEVQDVYMADCTKLNFVSAGITPDEAVDNLKTSIQNSLGALIEINPVFERR
jgi:predicted RNase H-like HicB family nuclease